MKIIYTQSKYKIRNLKNAEEKLNQRLTSAQKKRTKRRLLYGLNKNQRKYRFDLSKFVILKAPLNFSFIHNTEQILKYLDEIKKYLKLRKPVFIDLSGINNLTNDTIVLLLSVVKNPNIVNGVRIEGNYPKDKQLKKIFVESGILPSLSEASSTKNYILTREHKKADGKIADELIRYATSIVFKQEGRNQGIYRALMESMANTCYHAKPSQIGEETWWLTVYTDIKNNVVSFAFIDLGVGIFKSEKIGIIQEFLKSLFGLYDNIDILQKIISGKKESSTKIPYRGKGLPHIFKGLQRNYYSNLIIISNDVKADLSGNIYTKLSQEFEGTFLYWELNNTNRWIK